MRLAARPVGILIVLIGLVGAVAASAAQKTGDGWIAFDERTYHRGGGDSWEVFVVRPDGSGRRRVTPPGRWDKAQAGWSPDGRRIAFRGQSLNSRAKTGLFLIRVDGSG